MNLMVRKEATNLLSSVLCLLSVIKCHIISFGDVIIEQFFLNLMYWFVCLFKRSRNSHCRNSHCRKQFQDSSFSVIFRDSKLIFWKRSNCTLEILKVILFCLFYCYGGGIVFEVTLARKSFIK